MMSHPPVFRALAVSSKAKDHLAMSVGARSLLAEMAAENGFAADWTDDPTAISAENLANYQVFVMLHLAPFEMKPEQQAALQRFVESGKGWVGIHAAGLAGSQFVGSGAPYWQWFEDFLGGITYSPHPAYQKGTAIVEDRTHPATKNLSASFEMFDEWYEFSESPRDRVRVLVTADETTYQQKKPMGDHPIVWTNERYRRAIYIGLGHDTTALENDAYRTLLRDSLLWAAS
jgi:uncharacterized protein